MKKTAGSRALRVVHFAVIFGIVAGSMTIVGCSDPSNTVITDPNQEKNKRTAQVEKLKGLKPSKGSKSAGSEPRR